MLCQADQMQKVLSDPALAFPGGTIYDVREALSRVRIEGLFLDEAELFQLRQAIDYAAQLTAFLTGWMSSVTPGSVKWADWREKETSVKWSG